MSSSDIETVRLIVRDELLKNGNGDTKKPIKLSHEEIENGLMSTNFAICDGADCHGHVLKNTKFVKDFKTCTNCNTNSVPADKDICPTCGLSSGEWNESDVEFGNGEE